MKYFDRALAALEAAILLCLVGVALLLFGPELEDRR